MRKGGRGNILPPGDHPRRWHELTASLAPLLAQLAGEGLFDRALPAPHRRSLVQVSMAATCMNRGPDSAIADSCAMPLKWVGVCGCNHRLESSPAESAAYSRPLGYSLTALPPGLDLEKNCKAWLATCVLPPLLSVRWCGSMGLQMTKLCTVG
ncbi:complement C2 [Platysternon megacephalum]|uniref:Complement C2 n=1 Tax=Platysternon megacephalum TaxID=55544 RepID=A0A4D9DJE9_9SAUR|nr:complement C2 [Platysternon megacephalum]